MPVNEVVPGDVYGNRNLRKQIGCMNGIFQIFDRQHRHKRLLFGGQHQLEPHDAANALTDQEMEAQKQKPRKSTESSQVSNSSSSCSSTFSSLEHVRTNISESPLHTIDKKENGPAMSKGPQSPHIRNVVKDSMHREARGVPIKSFKTNNERKVTVMKHVDSPRPIQKPKSEKPKARSHEEPNRTFPRDERLIHRRLSFDGRESRDGLKTKHREFPRLSLDSKPSSVKCSGLDLRSDILGQESGGHSRTSSIVAKLMGLDDFPNVITTDETNVTATNPIINILPDPSKATKENKENKQTSFLKPTRSSRLPMEPAPWKQKDSSPDSPKMAAQSRKGPKSTQNSPYSSVYAEMEKRITELEFKRSGKDLRALKQILEAMQKTRDKLEKERRESTVHQNENKLLCSSNRVTKPPNVMEKMQMQSQAVCPVRGEKTKESRPKNEDKKGPRRCFSSRDKKTTSRNSELKQSIRSPQRMRFDNYAADRRDFGMASPRLQQNVLPSSGRAQKHSGKKVGELHSLSENAKLKSMGSIHHSYQGDTASIESESSNCLALQLDTEASSLAISTNLNCREKQKSPTSKEHMPAVELSVTLMEQPSPVSVLDAAFYIEESPSPVKKISTVFQGPDEAEWPLENLSHFTDKYNQKQRDISELMHIPTISKTKPSQTAVNQSGHVYQSLIQDKRYISKVLKASGLFRDTCIKPTNPISPVIFHILEEMEEDDNRKMQRRVIFDTVNEILVRKISAVARKRTGPQGIMRELYLEMDRLCGITGMSRGNIDDEDDGSIRLLNADMKYGSDDWTDYRDEVPANTLEIERLIFKDLINEVVNGQIEAHLLRD